MEVAEEGALLDSKIHRSKLLNTKSTTQANGMIEEIVLEVAVAVVANPRDHRDHQVAPPVHRKLPQPYRLLHPQNKK